MRRTAIFSLLLVLLAGCGRYGAPLRAQEYRDAQKERDNAEMQRREKSAQERNEPLPAPP